MAQACQPQQSGPCAHTLLQHALGQAHQATRVGTTLPIACWDIAQGSAAHIAVFALPPGACIPMHDHPGMHVFSKLLMGSMQVLSTQQDAAMLHTHTRSQGDSWHLTPSLHNIHAFINSGERHGPAVVLEVLTPPYSNERPCTYYQVSDKGQASALAGHPRFLNMVNLTAS